MKKSLVLAGVVLSSQIPSICFAANGTQLTGYGAKAAGMAGASVAFPQDAIAAANNPAGMAEVGSRVDGDFQILYVDTETEFLNSENKHSGKRYAPIPEFGVNYQVNDRLSLGFSTAASGVLFRYDDELIPNPNVDRAKGAFMQVIGLPTIAYKVTDQLSLGFSLALAAQRLEIQGIPLPDGSASNPAHGAEYSYGASWRAGALWKAKPWLSVGAMYASKIKMSNYNSYEDDLLSTTGGSIDIPEQYALGVAVKPIDNLTVALDWQHISWQNSDTYHETFGWRSQDIFRLGASYELSSDWTIRAGYSTTRKQFPTDYTLQNTLLVGINPKAATFGVTRDFKENGELTLGYEYDLSTSSKGTGASEGTKIRTNMGFVTVGYGWKF
ncbi:OmpP1/FadL family transporter [Pseudomonas laurylsulfatiphila]